MNYFRDTLDIFQSTAFVNKLLYPFWECISINFLINRYKKKSEWMF